jgi:ComF family protein
MLAIADVFDSFISLAAPPACGGCTASLSPPSKIPRETPDSREFTAPRCRSSGSDPARAALRDVLCPACRRALPVIRGRACPACARPHARSGACAAVKDDVLAIAAFGYRGVARRLLRTLKYEGRRDLAAPLGRALARRIVAARPELARSRPLVAAVPLHWTRRLSRGFNQAALIAEEVARALGADVAPRALARARRTPALFEIDRDARSPVLDGAFRARAEIVRGRVVLLVDDIRTSGSTLDACARALLDAGAARVVTATVAA